MKNKNIKNVDNFNKNINKLNLEFFTCLNKFKSLFDFNDIFFPSSLNEIKKYTNIKPFWNNYISNISNNIFLPIENNIKSYKTPYKLNNTWFNCSFFRAKYKQNPIIIDEQQNNNIIEEKIIKTKKFVIYPNQIQKQYLFKFFSCYRYFYNRTIEYFNNIDLNNLSSFYTFKDDDKNKKIKLKFNNKNDMYNKYNLRKLLTQNKPKWIIDLKIDTHSINNSIFEAIKNFNTNLKLNKKQKRIFKMKYKSKKDKNYIINLDGRIWSKKFNILFSTYKVNNSYIFRNLKLNVKHKIISKINYKSFTIQYNTLLNKFYLLVSYEDNIKDLNNNKSVSIDPGVRTFITCYEQSNVFKIGEEANKEINKLCKEIDKIQSIKDKEENKIKKKRLNKAIYKKYEKINNKIEELHNKTINYLINNYKEIIIPPFETQEMVRTLKNKTSRELNNFKFYKFEEKLKNKCKEYNIRIINYNEAYTSKTCGRCGNIDLNLGNKEIYKCEKCGLEIDRDINGARNIMLKNKYGNC